MPVTIVETFHVKNVANNSVIVNVSPLSGSTIFDADGGNIALRPQGAFEAERDRFDRQQLTTLQNNRQIEVTPLRRQIGGGSS